MISNYEQEDLWGNEIYYQINQEGLTLKPVVTPIDMWNVTNIRELVFRKEQNVPYLEDEMFEEQLEAKTYLIYLKDKVIGTIRYRYVKDTYKIERFAILKEYRNKGYGKQAFNYFIDMIATDFNPCTITLNSQEPVIKFYENLGFIPEGEMFLEAGIKHLKMNKIIK